MPPNLLKIWMWGVRAYALLCIAVLIVTGVFHAAYPQYQGIPRWLFVLVWLPMAGVEVLPAILLIDVVLAVKVMYRKRAVSVQLTLLVVAFCFCLRGLR